MSDKIFKSTWTWRTLAQQEETLKDAVIDFDGAPRFIDEDRESMLRHTRRSTSYRIHVASISNIAKDDDDLRKAVTLLNARKAFLHCEEENTIWHPNTPFATWLKAFKQSRTSGSAMIGGRISADNRKAKSAAGAANIKDRWRLPTDEWPTHVLLKEADISLNTAKLLLGKRPLVQAQYQAAQKRKARKS